MIAESVVLSIIIGWFRKGKLIHLGQLDVKGLFLFFLGGTFQLFVFAYSKESGNTVQQWMFENFYGLHLISYCIIMIPLVINYKWLGLNLMGIGTLLNFMPIMLNNGKMPVALPVEYSPVFDLGHVLLEAHTKLKLLSDIIFIGPPYPMPKVLSIGDLFIMGGVFWLIQVGMQGTKNELEVKEQIEL
jgi:hypothetical protein